jgi:hypothetical protein
MSPGIRPHVLEKIIRSGHLPQAKGAEDVFLNRTTNFEVVDKLYLLTSIRKLRCIPIC